MSAAEPIQLTVRVAACRLEAERIQSFELQALPGEILPPFTAGAHLDVLLPGSIERSYSLCNPPSESQRYRIAVQREPESRGGSAYMCDTLRVGDTLRIKCQPNAFALDEDAPLTILIAGGIGLTPLLAMAYRLEQLGRPWRLFRASRTKAAAPFGAELAELAKPDPARITEIFDDNEAGQRLDLQAIVASHPVGTHFYCCGPAGMLHSFEAATAALPPGHARTEYFAADQAAAAGGFEVLLARSNQVFQIPADKTILETLLAAGMNLPRSCMEGVCGTCETVVLDGLPDHRDQVLTARERRANDKMMICRSGSLGPRLVLDL